MIYGQFYWRRDHVEQVMAAEMLGVPVYEAIDLVAKEHKLVPMSNAYYQHFKNMILKQRNKKK